MKYKKIFVPLDRSAQSEIIFEQALEAAKQNEANLMLFHCLSFESNSTEIYNVYGQALIEASQRIHEQMQKEIESSKQWLSAYAQKATEAGVSVEWDCKVGEAASWIRDISTNWGADLIVIGRRGRKGLSEMFLGSVSNYIIHHVPCSVLIVQGIK